MKEIAAACAAYFQEHPAYHRILVLLFQKVKSFGGPAGTVRLDDATPEECDAARALFGRSFSAPLRIKTADFEAALQNTPYRGVTLKEVLECYFHTAIQTKREIRSQEDARILRITKGAATSVESPLCLRWLEELSTHRGGGLAAHPKVVGQRGRSGGAGPFAGVQKHGLAGRPSRPEDSLGRPQRLCHIGSPCLGRQYAGW